MKKIALLFVSVILLVFSGKGQDITLMAWETAGIPSTAITSYDATTVADDMSTSVLTRGSGLTATALGNAFAASGWNVADLAAAITGEKYFQVTVEASAGYKTSLSSIEWNFRRSGTGPNAMQWHYSIDGSTFSPIDLATSYTSNPTNGTAFGPIDLSGITALQNVESGTVITLRLYAWGATASTGTGAIGRLPGDDLVIVGTVESAAGVTNITAAPSSFSDFSYVAGSGPSASQSFTVEGENLTSNLVISAPANFEISSDNVNFQTTDIYYVPAGGDVAQQTLYVRLAAGLSLGAYSGDIEVSSAGATSRTIACSAYVEDAQFASLPYSNDFSSGFGKIYTYDAGGTASWTAPSGYASINGYLAGVNDDWMILPGIDFSAYTDVELSFDMWWRHGSQDANNYLKLFYSTNYNGYGDPSAASWTEISFTAPSSDQSWTSSGIIDLSTLTASNVNLAFKYRSDDAARLWHIDNILVQEHSTLPPPPPVILPNAWINQLHYRNTGTDVDEFVQVVIENAGDYDLSDFTVTLYNGANGLQYGLSPSLDQFTAGDVEGDYSIFYYTYPTNGIQNGDPDGLSLDWQGEVIQFLSYGGTFTALNGVADGVSSVDIGLSQSTSNPVGQALQLSGIGLQYSHFNWTSGNATPGTKSASQFFSTPPPPVPFKWHFMLIAFMLLAGTLVYRKLR